MRSTANDKKRVTWIEAAIITVVLAVMAAMAVPQFSEASTDSREKELHTAVQIVQGQIEMYRAQHDNAYPTLASFADQMTLCTDNQGSLNVPAGSSQLRGPYLRAVPVNPFSGTRDVSNTPCGSSAWYYDEITGQFRPNHAALN